MEEQQGNLTQEEIETIATSRTFEYQLAWPVEIGTMEPLTTVELTRFKGKQIKAISKIKDAMEQGVKMVELSANLTPLQVDEMDITDLTNLMEICSVFMDASQTKRKQTIGN